MRIWHSALIPFLCRNHILAAWRESIGAYKIITGGMKCSYANHPATLEFKSAPFHLLERLLLIRKEMLRRGYQPKEIPTEIDWDQYALEKVNEWQDLGTQIELIHSKGCNCCV